MNAYRPKDIPAGKPRPYGPGGQQWPHLPDASTSVFPYDGVSWGFYDWGWRGEDGTARGRLQINVWPEGAPADEKSFSTWAKFDDYVGVVDRIQSAIRVAYEAGQRAERQRNISQLGA